MSKDQLIIFDTTLRDGEQSPGASMTRDEKLRIARQLERMRVDVIEAGFPAASNGDFEAVKAVAEHHQGLRPSPASCRAFDKDIARALEAVKPAKSGRIHTFIATSPIHMQKKLRWRPSRSSSGATPVKLGAQRHRRRRVLLRGRRPVRNRFPLPHHRGGDQGGRVDHQHPGHRRLQRARAVCGLIPSCANASRTPTR
jgi:hypothetical protein